MYDLLECCRREQIPVVLVLTPESSVFRGWYSADALSAVRQMLSELSEAHGVRIIDSRQWLADTDFLDGHHVLASGAKIFTTRLLDELRPLLARLAQTGAIAPEYDRPGTSLDSSVERPLP
jgi:hypothetical protein